MLAPKVTEDVLNPSLYDVNNVEIQFYQLRKAWPWTKGYIHAMGWVYFASGLVLIFGLLNLRDILLDRRRLRNTLANSNKHQAVESKRSLFDRMSLHFRSFCYLRSSLPGVATTSFGLGALIVAGFLYPVLYVFTQHPYYEREPQFGPPPLAGRAGMIALAMTPFVIMLGMKANLISLITGMGHEKLNVLHRWLGFSCGFFSLVHAIPYIVEPLKNGGWSKLSEVFNSHVTYWNGVGAIVCMFWLTFGSLNFIRFVYSHSHFQWW
jgi:Ferric reductase like transmembrane component